MSDRRLDLRENVREKINVGQTMKGKLSDWADIAQVLSGFAVLITLVFLVIEIRDGTNVTRASMYAGFASGFVNNRTIRVQDPELNRIVLLFTEEGAELAPEEAQRIAPYLSNIFQLYDAAFFSQRYQVIGELEWERFERNICTNYGRAITHGLEGAISGVVSDEFWLYVTAACEE